MHSKDKRRRKSYETTTKRIKQVRKDRIKIHKKNEINAFRTKKELEDLESAIQCDHNRPSSIFDASDNADCTSENN